MTISDKIFKELKEKHISQKAFSEATGIATSTISDWKKKHTNPTTEKLLIISHVLGISVEELLSGSAPEESRCNPCELVTYSTNSEIGNIVAEYQQLNENQRGRLVGYLKALSEENKINS